MSDPEYLSTEEIWVDETISTMDLARSLVGDNKTLLVVAGRQSGGRGTRGREWVSTPGNIHMTAVFREDLTAGIPRGLLPMEVGVALHRALKEVVSHEYHPAMSLKWPNDLLLDQQKVAGVLLEWYGRYLLCGIGVNLTSAPEVMDGGRASACLMDYGATIGQEKSVARRIFRELKTLWQGPSENRTCETLLGAYRSLLDWNIGFTVRQRPELGRVSPVEINSEGHLRVKTVAGESVWLVSDYPA